jgi:signal transduction histidine kinase
MNARNDVYGPRFGFRLKVPLALTAVALLSGIVVAATTYLLVDRHVQANAEAETQRLAGTLARALAQPMLRQDVWQAYELLRATTPSAATAPFEQTVRVVVLDAQGQVFASPTPRQHPLGQHLSQLPQAQAEAARRVFASSPLAAARVSAESGSVLVLAAPIVGEEDTLLGLVLASHPRALTESQRAAVIRQLVVLGAMAMLLVALVGGAIGLRLVTPLARLRAAMQAAPRRDTADSARQALDKVSARPDEIGDLGRSFAAMLDQIAAQQELERHMLQAERMASIGQLTAGIAHEVNNPLGGMLAAIENRRLRGELDEASARTLGLLERGLRQVHATVQALLNEARSESHPLTEADLRDLELLLRPEAEHARCTLHWSAAMPDGQHLPAVPVRQVLLNLTLNAVGAAGQHGQVRVWSQQVPGGWQVWVGNSGAALDEAKLAALTQGSERSAEGRLGLGLWVTARILHTLGGRLRLAPAIDAMATVLVAEFPGSPMPVLPPVSEAALHSAAANPSPL